MASHPSEFSLQNCSAMLKMTSFESLLYGVLALIQDSGYTLPLWFLQSGQNDDSTQEAIYIYTSGWMLLSLMAFMLNILLTNCMARLLRIRSGGAGSSVVTDGCFGLFEMATTPPSENGLVPILAIARVPSDVTMQESLLLVPFEVQDSIP
ncbi:hypothetical protein ARMGADRAFT_1031187 [Armillaria gallica]|uniref:Uncharacterized protein n=1 Tax=Armillaria gallica TaxID=47427 RepID=A0A2H3DLG1_ARMGA|nr:hypothetical protein ARMGADRAFT_1031187 [Armillaria gallica]